MERDLLERRQQRETAKMLRGLKQLCDEEGLKELGLLRLEKSSWGEVSSMLINTSKCGCQEHETRLFSGAQ